MSFIISVGALRDEKALSACPGGRTGGGAAWRARHAPRENAGTGNGLARGLPPAAGRACAPGPPWCRLAGTTRRLPAAGLQALAEGQQREHAALHGPCLEGHLAVADRVVQVAEGHPARRRARV